MGYTYEQRKRPHGPQNTAPERTNAPGPGHNALMPGTAATQNGPSFDLDGAMQARMTDTFGDLSAVRNYTPPEKSQAPVPTGPYTGPVTHAISNASPSPSVAGPMQAKRRDADAKGAKALRKAGRRINERYALPSYPGYKSLNPQVWEERTHTPGFSRHFGKRPERFKVRKKSSYLAYENAQQYSNGNNLTRLHEKPEDDLLLREDEDSNVVSKKMLKSYQRENNAALDRMFHIRAGLLAESNHNRGPSTATKDRKRKEFKKEAIEKGLKGYSIEEYADDKLDEYVKKNKPKKPLQIVSKEDRDWYDFMTSYGMNEDLLNAIYDKTVQTGKALVDYRKNLGKQNPNTPSNKLDFISAYSDQAREFSLYRDIRSDVNTDANSSMENHIEKLKQRKDYYENKPTVDAAEALYGAGDSSNNDFVNSEEGQSMLPAFEKKTTQQTSRSME